jgi:CHASE2 domain-containing sensor protein
MSLSEDKLKQFIALIGCMVCLFAYLGGYISGVYGWWWTIILVPMIYAIIMNTLNGGGGHH